MIDYLLVVKADLLVVLLLELDIYRDMVVVDSFFIESDSGLACKDSNLTTPQPGSTAGSSLRCPSSSLRLGDDEVLKLKVIDH